MEMEKQKNQDSKTLPGNIKWTVSYNPIETKVVEGTSFKTVPPIYIPLESPHITESGSDNRPTEPGNLFNSNDAELLEYAVRQAFVGKLPRAVERIVLSFEGKDVGDTFSIDRAIVRIALKDCGTGQPETYSSWINEKLKVILNGVAPPVGVQLMDPQQLQEWENSILQDSLQADFIPYERHRWIFAPGYQTYDIFE